MTDIDKRTKIVFGGRRQGKSMVMKGLQMTIFKEAMRKAFQAGVSYEQTGRMSNREPQAPDFETFFADFERDIRNGPRSHAKHDTHMQIVGRGMREMGGAADPVPVKNYGLQAAAAAYLSDPEQRVRDMVKADYADLGRPEPPVAMTTTATDADLPFKGLAEVEREIRAAFHVPREMLGGDYVPGIVGARTGRFSSTAPNESNPPRFAAVLPQGCEHHRVSVKDEQIVCMTCERALPGLPNDSTVFYTPPQGSIPDKVVVSTTDVDREGNHIEREIDTRDVSDAQDAEQVADEWRDNGSD